MDMDELNMMPKFLIDLDGLMKELPMGRTTSDREVMARGGCCGEELCLFIVDLQLVG